MSFKSPKRTLSMDDTVSVESATVVSKQKQEIDPSIPNAAIPLRQAGTDTNTMPREEGEEERRKGTLGIRKLRNRLSRLVSSDLTHMKKPLRKGVSLSSSSSMVVAAAAVSAEKRSPTAGRT